MARFAGLLRPRIAQRNGRPNHPQTKGRLERLWQTLKKWPAARHPNTAATGELTLNPDRDYQPHRQATRTPQGTPRKTRNPEP